MDRVSGKKKKRRKGDTIFSHVPLSLWLQLFDFEDPKVKALFDEFCNRLNRGTDKEAQWADNLSQYWLNAMQELESLPAPNKDTPKPILPSNLIPRMMEFLELSPLEIARSVVSCLLLTLHRYSQSFVFSTSTADK
jgi:hypothetical protein